MYCLIFPRTYVTGSEYENIQRINSYKLNFTCHITRQCRCVWNIKTINKQYELYTLWLPKHLHLYSLDVIQILPQCVECLIQVFNYFDVFHVQVLFTHAHIYMYYVKMNVYLYSTYVHYNVSCVEMEVLVQNWTQKNMKCLMYYCTVLKQQSLITLCITVCRIV